MTDGCTATALGLHRDERGSLSLISVFSVLLLTILLGMVINTGRQVDSKVRLQNAADAVTHSSGVVLARSMNSLAFSNHLLCDIMGLTAFLREARDGHAASLTPEILAAWQQIGPVLATSGFAKFDALGGAIPEKVRLEQQMVDKYSAWVGSIATLVLPVFEELLATEAIPTYQRAVVALTPLQVQLVAADMAARHSTPVSRRDQARGPLAAVLWRTAAVPVGGDAELLSSTLPVVDPLGIDSFEYERELLAARDRRDAYARHYLNRWNAVYLAPFRQEARMSQFDPLWRGFTCGQLERLLEENRNRNLPMILRVHRGESVGNLQLHRDYMFIGVTYWNPLVEAMPGVFSSPLATFDDQKFAQGFLFVSGSSGWSLWNQNWNFKLVPATTDALPTILASNPNNFAVPTLPRRDYRPPPIAGLSPRAMRQMSVH
jgi:hypothetical protein